MKSLSLGASIRFSSIIKRDQNLLDTFIRRKHNNKPSPSSKFEATDSHDCKHTCLLNFFRDVDSPDERARKIETFTKLSILR